MKKIMLAVCLLFGGATLVQAQDQSSQTTQNQSQSTMDQDQDREQISASELPDAVSSKLESQDYASWTIGDVWKKTDESQNEIYIVELKQGSDTKKVKFDKDGNKIDKGMKGDMKDDKSGSNEYRSSDQSNDATLEDASSGDAASQDATDQTDNSGSETQTERP